jgi:hypothetical protein
MNLSLSAYTTTAFSGTIPNTPGYQIQVMSTAAFTLADINYPGVFYLQTSTGIQTITYTNLSGNMFKGCSGGSGSYATGASCTYMYTFLTSSGSLPNPVLNVVSTLGFADFGTIIVNTSNGPQQVTYTGMTSTSFTGCTTMAVATFTAGSSVTVAPPTGQVLKGSLITDSDNNIVVPITVAGQFAGSHLYNVSQALVIPPTYFTFTATGIGGVGIYTMSYALLVPDNSTFICPANPADISVFSNN